MDEADHQRTRQRNKIVHAKVAKKQDKVKEDDERLEIKLQQKLGRNIHRFKQNQQPRNIRLHLSRYFDGEEQHPLIIQYLISFLGKASPQQEIRKKCLKYIQLKLKNGHSMKQGFSLQELSDQKKKSIQDYIQKIEERDKQIEAGMQERKENILRSEQLLIENKSLNSQLEKQQDLKDKYNQKKQELEKERLKGRQKGIKDNTRQQIKQKFKIAYEQTSSNYQQLEKKINQYRQQRQLLRKQQAEEKKLRQKYIYLCNQKVEVQKLKTRLQHKIQKQSNLLNLNLSSIPDRSNIPSIGSEGISNGASLIYQLREKSEIQYRSQIYNFEEMPQNRFIKIILVVIAVILGIALLYGFINRAMSEPL